MPVVRNRRPRRWRDLHRRRRRLATTRRHWRRRPEARGREPHGVQLLSRRVLHPLVTESLALRIHPLRGHLPRRHPVRGVPQELLLVELAAEIEQVLLEFARVALPASRNVGTERALHKDGKRALDVVEIVEWRQIGHKPRESRVIVYELY